MIKQSDKISLEELAQKQYPVLFDSSVIIGGLDDNVELKTLKEKIDAAKRDKDFYFLMRNYIKKGCNFYTTHQVIDELMNYKGYAPKENKKISCSFPKHNEVLNLFRKRLEMNKEKHRLVNTFQDKDRIFKLNKNDENIYDFLSKKYFYLKEEYKLSETDFDFLICAMSRAKKTGAIALATNDLKIFHAAESILEKEDIHYRVELFIREKLLGFKRICDSFSGILHYV